MPSATKTLFEKRVPWSRTPKNVCLLKSFSGVQGGARPAFFKKAPWPSETIRKNQKNLL